MICKTLLDTQVGWLGTIYPSLLRNHQLLMRSSPIDLSTARPQWRHDGPALLGHLLYPLVNHAYANRYYHHLFRYLVSTIIRGRYSFRIIISIQASDA